MKSSENLDDHSSPSSFGQVSDDEVDNLRDKDFDSAVFNIRKVTPEDFAVSFSWLVLKCLSHLKVYFLEPHCSSLILPDAFIT